jgi:hypothetical protein
VLTTAKRRAIVKSVQLYTHNASNRTNKDASDLLYSLLS